MAITNRRGFVVGLTASVFGVAGVWEALGLLTGGHGHGSHGDEDLGPDAFQVALEGYLRRYRRPDGVVEPPRSSGDPDHGSGGSEPGTGGDHDDGGDGHDDHEAVPLYLKAVRWNFVPEVYRLATGVTYDVRMMSFDVTHGAAIRAGTGSVVHRLPPGTLVRDRIRFDDPGEYPVYCSFFCGEGHNGMSATLVVEE